MYISGSEVESELDPKLNLGWDGCEQKGSEQIFCQIGIERLMGNIMGKHEHSEKKEMENRAVPGKQICPLHYPNQPHR